MDFENLHIIYSRKNLDLKSSSSTRHCPDPVNAPCVANYFNHLPPAQSITSMRGISLSGLTFTLLEIIITQKAWFAHWLYLMVFLALISKFKSFKSCEMDTAKKSIILVVREQTFSHGTELSLAR